MKKKTSTILLSLALVVALSACGNATENSSETSKQENGATEEQAATEKPAETKVEFEKGVFIDLEKENNPLLNEQIKAVLKKNLDAQVNLDEEAFRSTFKDLKTSDAYMGTFGGEYKFTKIYNISEDKTKDQILVNVTGEMLRDNAIEDAAITYYFAADADGKWSIVAID
ncbi:hypothetical protein SAMN05428961_11714 [Paenibacillus sp. OK060]|uniref:hypothetical protein n=1 Tax=Paenibacillus sp. OK060 TaxID=1881034 RepID=UPI00088A8652|nr:hypothetical protein [Paenibacillus sp. OK060]SDM41925.1 hypothetical protein SAMN05428961_11714 [Paenibacillus sp. OK060]